MRTAAKILFVDDEPNVLRALHRSFLDENYEILTAQSGPEALDMLASEMPVQLVISDYRMPGMNGVEFLRKVCARWPETIRIVLSGFADAPAVVSSINEGKIFRFIPKPWDEQELKASIREGVEQFSNVRAIEHLQATVQQLEEENTELLHKSQEVATRLLVKDRAFSRAADILNALPIGILGIDTLDRVVFCNQAGESIMQTQVIGFAWDDLFPLEDRLQVQHGLGESGRFSGTLTAQDRSFEVEAYFLRPTTRQGILLILKGSNHV